MTDEQSVSRTLVTSLPKWETDDLRFVTVTSENLKGRGDVTLFVPPEVERLQDVPSVILLHGVFGSHWNWTFRGGLHLTARRLIDDRILPPIVIAMPSDGLKGEGTAYLPQRDGNFERWIVDDVPELVRDIVPTVTKASRQFIAGLSMGGFGAMRIGAKYGRRFSGVSAHSSVTVTEQFVGIIDDLIEETSLVPTEHELLDLIVAHREQLPPLRFDCGVDDPLVVHNRDLHRGLVESGIQHTYEEFPGTHEWAYWERHIEDTLRFFARLLLRD